MVLLGVSSLAFLLGLVCFAFHSFENDVSVAISAIVGLVCCFLATLGLWRLGETYASRYSQSSHRWFWELLPNPSRLLGRVTVRFDLLKFEDTHYNREPHLQSYLRRVSERSQVLPVPNEDSEVGINFPLQTIPSKQVSASDIYRPTAFTFSIEPTNTPELHPPSTGDPILDLWARINPLHEFLLEPTPGSSRISQIILHQHGLGLALCAGDMVLSLSSIPPFKVRKVFEHLEGVRYCDSGGWSIDARHLVVADSYGSIWVGDHEVRRETLPEESDLTLLTSIH